MVSNNKEARSVRQRGKQRVDVNVHHAVNDVGRESFRVLTKRWQNSNESLSRQQKIALLSRGMEVDIRGVGRRVVVRIDTNSCTIFVRTLRGPISYNVDLVVFSE